MMISDDRSRLRASIDSNRLPEHIAVIMDGNGRWAKQQGRPRVFGHKNGVKSVREITEGAAELGVSYITLYAFSTENWQRSNLEVNALMTLLVQTLESEIDTLMKNDIRLGAIGDIDGLPKRTARALRAGIDRTRDNRRMTLNLALNYSARWDMIQATKRIAEDVTDGHLHTDEIDSALISRYLTTHDIPDPELIIRTSGEQRLSNFLLWESAYTEFHFTPTLWPDFSRDHLYQAIIDYQGRQRRFGRES